MWRKLVKLILILLLVVSIFLRFYKLGSIPQGLNIDEASYGYDAYSLLKTGKDQWGHPWPITLKSFGDYKPSALSYAIIPFIKLFGLNSLAVRLPSAIAGLLILFILFFTLQELNKSIIINLFLTLIFSLSPWAYGISRLFYESNVGLLFFLLGLFNIIKSYKNKTYFNLFLAIISFAISGYWYFAIRVVSALVVGFVLAEHMRKGRKNFKNILFISSIYIVIVSPLIVTTFSKTGLTRLRQESQGQDYANSLIINENRAMCYLSSNKNVQIGKICSFWWNKPVLKIEHIVKSLLYQLSPNYLFLDQTQLDILPKTNGPYIWGLIPFYLIGWYAIITTKRNKQLKLFLIVTFVFSNLPASVAGSPKIHRNVTGIYLSFIFIAFGFWYIYELISRFKTNLYKQIFLTIIVFTLSFQTSKFLIYYFSVYTKQQPELWRYDSGEIFNYVISHEKEYDNIWFINFEDAPLYYAFYKPLEPSIFQNQVIREAPHDNGWIHNLSINKIKSIRNVNLMSLVCQHELYSKSNKELVITSNLNNKLNSQLFFTQDFTQTFTLHEVYDLDTLSQRLKESGWDATTNCQ